MKLLIITHSYTPDLNPRAFRWAAVAEQLAGKGHEVHVLCATAGDPQRLENGVIVHRVDDWLLSAYSRMSKGAAPANGMSPKSLLRPPWHRSVRWLARELWRALRWPDYACGWVSQGVRTVRLLCAANRFDWIISVSHPFSGHLVALLAKSAGEQARWFVDVGDPFHLMNEPSPNNWRLYAWLNRRMESRVLSTADAISVTTSATQNRYETFFALPPGKVRILPPLLSLPAAPPPSARAEDGTLRLVFVGTLYRKLRNPRFLLACFSALRLALPGERVELHFYGAVNDCADEFAGFSADTARVLFIHGLVERGEVLQAMVDASVLVNIGNNSEDQLASKVIEYMSLCKPILNLTSSTADASLIPLASYPSVLNLPANSSLTPAKIEALRAFVLDSPFVPPQVAVEVRQTYSAEHVSTCYEEILKGSY